MKKFFEKYVTDRIHERLLVSGLKYGELWKYKEGEYLPKPATLYKICFVVAAESKMDVNDVLYDAVQCITGDKA
jgi:hypothetical protein